MPLALDTNEVFRYVFSTDRGKHDAPALLFHFPTCREARAIANLFDAADKAATVDDAFAKRCEAVKLKLCGWENFPAPFDPAQLDAVLSDADVTELRSRLLSEMSVSEVEKKVSAFSVLSSLAKSAKDAGPAGAGEPSIRPNSNA